MVCVGGGQRRGPLGRWESSRVMHDDVGSGDGIAGKDMDHRLGIFAGK